MTESASRFPAAIVDSVLESGRRTIHLLLIRESPPLTLSERMEMHACLMSNYFCLEKDLLEEKKGDVQLSRLFPRELSPTLANNLKEIAGVSTVTEFLMASEAAIKEAIRHESKLMKEVVLGMYTSNLGRWHIIRVKPSKSQNRDLLM
jgi:hypothetical protein